MHSSLLVWLLLAAVLCCLPHSAFLFPSCNATIRVRDSLQNNTPSSLSPARRCGGERNSSSQFGVPRHSSMTARLTYAVNYANSYSMRSSDSKWRKKKQNNKKYKIKGKEIEKIAREKKKGYPRFINY